MHRSRLSSLVVVLALLASACATSGGNAAGRSATRAGRTALIELNTATAAELQTLPGITAAYARRIIANRPYKVKHELETRKILPASVYSRIRERVIATEGSRGPLRPDL